MQVDPGHQQTITLGYQSYTALAGIAHRRAAEMIHDTLRLILNRPAALPCAITDFNILPIDGREQFTEAAQRGELCRIIGGVSAAAEKGMKGRRRFRQPCRQNVVVKKDSPEAALE